MMPPESSEAACSASASLSGLGRPLGRSRSRPGGEPQGLNSSASALMSIFCGVLCTASEAAVLMLPGLASGTVLMLIFLGVLESSMLPRASARDKGTGAVPSMLSRE